jgi:hypothetical protein
MTPNAHLMKHLLQCHIYVFIWIRIAGLQERTNDKNRETETAEMHFFRAVAGYRMTES